MAEWAFRAASAVATGTTSLVITKPAGVIDDDVLVMALSHKGAGYATVPAGWTLIAQNISTAIRGELYWKRAASEGADYTVTGLADTACGVIRAWSGGLLSGDVVHLSASAAQAATVGIMPSVTTTIANVLVVTMVASGAASALSGGLGNGSLMNDPPFYSGTVGSTTTGTDCAIGLIEGIQQHLGPTQDTGVSPDNPMTWGVLMATSVLITAALLPEPAAITTATRFYLTQRSHGTFVQGAPQGDWSGGASTRDNRGVNHWTYLASPVKAYGQATQTLSQLTGGVVPIIDGTGPEELYGVRWATPQLAAQTLTGTFQITLPVRAVPITATTTTVVYHVHVYVARGDDLADVVGVLVDNYIDGGAWTSTMTWRQLSGAQTMDPVEVLAGDRVVIEVGVSATASPAAHQGVANWQLGTSLASGLAYQDGPTSGAFSASLAPYVDVSNALTLRNETLPTLTNGTRATATPITLPFDSGAINSLASPASRQQLWWIGTAAADGIWIATTWGGNTQTFLAPFEDSSAIAMTQQNRGQWIQTSQSAVPVVVTAGRTYAFRVYDNTFAGGATRLRVTAYDAPARDDLFVNCQHIVRFRAGAATDLTSLFYNSTPTGAALDYSRQPIVDLADAINTSERLFVCLFGDDPLIEVLQADGLYDENTVEVGFLFDPLNPATHSNNLASVVFDRAYNTYAGYFGDAYSVVGDLSTPAACAITVLPLTHVDQSGPWPDATRLVVDQDVGGTDYVDLDSTNTVLFYTSSGTAIKRCLLDGTQLADFASVPNAPGPRPGCRGLRILPPGDGRGGLLVANGSRVDRLNGAGDVIQSYVPTATARAQDLDKVEIYHDQARFAVSDQYSTSIFVFDLDGTEVAEYRTGLPPGQLSGFDIYEGYRAALVVTQEVRPIRFVRIFPHLNEKQLNLFVTRIEIELQRGVGLISGQGSDPAFLVSASHDGGMTYSAERFISPGDLGKYLARAKSERWGRARDWVFKLVISDPVLIALAAVYLDVEQGNT